MVDKNSHSVYNQYAENRILWLLGSGVVARYLLSMPDRDRIVWVCIELGRGYSFDAIRAELPFNGHFHVKRPVYRKRRQTMAEQCGPQLSQFLLDQPPTEKTELNYGTSITTLIEAFASGDE